MPSVTGTRTQLPASSAPSPCDSTSSGAETGFASTLTIVSTIGQLSGCLTYIFLLLVAFHSPRAHRFVAPIGAVGRLALTNYLMHSIVFTTRASGCGEGR